MKNIYWAAFVAVLVSQMGHVCAQAGTAGLTIGTFFYATNISGYANSSLDVRDMKVSHGQ